MTTDDTRRLYPEAYGADYVAARDSYLTRAPVEVLLLLDQRAHGDETAIADLKARIRRAIGADELHNHLHMPDNPGEALADIAHLAGNETLAELYERYERDHAAERLAFYRSALGVGAADSHSD
ncbi:hypothetical protein J4573_08440 [Actinomadura barringtoniae]|uniref:Uncharacterized protein n=1 Tax=Actinomadura barringtoniae TaxID=1427535 RepID=A0A939T2T7_9ACTN|nr:hypothetical protein [Actinomadura barringtoniae]MBO2447113.1 hypothetical protein [Actinomadura barringtoniae]